MPALAQVPVTETWDDFAVVSSTMGAYQGRLCAGADRGDLGCPTYAPSLTTAGDVSVTGNLSASKFIGDGSALTGLSSTSDRITSGTSSVIVSQSGHISFTTAGTERMVINSAGNVGIGTSTPTAALQINHSGTTNALEIRRTTHLGSQIFTIGTLGDITGGVATFTQKLGHCLAALTATSSMSGWPAAEFKGASGQTADIFRVKNSAEQYLMLVAANGNVGIGTTSPGQTLDVSGTARIVSRTMIGGTGTPSATLQVSGSLLLAGSDSTTCNDAYVGILRRNPTTGRLQVCK